MYVKEDKGNTMRACRVDRNHKEIVEALRCEGFSVESLATVGKGVPDIIVGHNSCNLLLEIKSKGGKLTPDQVTWHFKWQGQVDIVNNIEEAVNLCKKYFKKTN